MGKAKAAKITDEAKWLEKKKRYVTSTEVAALYGLSKWQTAFELWHMKRGNIPHPEIDNNFLKFGKIIEQPICEMIVLEHEDWKIEEFPYFIYDDEDKIGSSFDRVVKINGQNWLLEIKSISYAQYMDKFIEHEKDDIEASPQYEVQMQVELEMASKFSSYNFAGCVMAVFILDTRELRYIFRDKDDEVCAEIRQAVRDFWTSEEPPEPDWARDKTIIGKVCPFLEPDTVMDATERDDIEELAAQYKASKDLIKQETEAADAAYAKLMVLVGTNKLIWSKGHKITVSDIKPNSGKPITQDMVGQITGARDGYKRLTITPQKKGK